MLHTSSCQFALNSLAKDSQPLHCSSLLCCYLLCLPLCCSSKETQDCISRTCAGYLPGNCKYEHGQGYVMCNAGSKCSEFGLPYGSGCVLRAACKQACDAAEGYGGMCAIDTIPWQLLCSGNAKNVQVNRAQVTLPGHGVIACDMQIDTP
jgi:hypothetical protein